MMLTCKEIVSDSVEPFDIDLMDKKVIVWIKEIRFCI